MGLTFFEGDDHLVVAHRGFAVEHPENTLPAFYAALDEGADILETDAHVTADGVAVLCHDPGLGRIAGRNGLIDSFSLKTLQGIDLGGAVIPSLRETLDAFPDARFSVDVKHPRAVQPVISAIRDAKAVERVIIGSFSERRRRATVQGLPGALSLANSAQVVPAYLGSAVGWDALFTKGLSPIDALFLPPRAYGVDLFRQHFIDRLTAHGLTMGVWTINDPDQMRDYWARGVRAIVTDRTDLAVAARNQMGGISARPR